jgi:hypothetical protein
MPQCIGLKPKGVQCTFKARSGFQTCGMHKKQEPAPVVPAPVAVVVPPGIGPLSFAFMTQRQYMDRCYGICKNGRECQSMNGIEYLTCGRHRKQEQMIRIRVDEGIILIPFHPQFVHLVNPQPIPDVFVADPEGTVNLQAFGQDKQSIHRSSVQNETRENLKLILAVPLKEPMLPDANSAYMEFLFALAHNGTSDKNIMKAIRVLRNECRGLITSFDTDHLTVFNHIWSYIQDHEHKDEMIKRLCEEVMESEGMCSNGKIARLVNAVQGFMDGLSAPVSKMEVFQGKIAKLMEMPLMKRVALALELFKEFEIPEDQQETWFSPLVA